MQPTTYQQTAACNRPEAITEAQRAEYFRCLRDTLGDGIAYCSPGLLSAAALAEGSTTPEEAALCEALGMAQTYIAGALDALNKVSPKASRK